MILRLKQFSQRFFWCVVVVHSMAFTCGIDQFPNHSDSSPTFSPDGETIAYFHYEPSLSTSYPSGIYTIDKNGGNRKFLPVNPDAEFLDYRNLVWSPDGQLLAFNDHNDGGLTLCGPDGSGRRSLGTEIGSFSWSADSQFLVYADGDELQYISIDFLTQGKLFGKTITGSSPEFTRDGGKLLYGLPAGFQGELVILDSAAEIANLQAEFSDYYRSCHWSPDGTKIVYTREENHFGAVVVINADGSDPVRIDRGIARSWSVKNEIAYVRGEGFNGEIFVASPDGEHIRQVTFGE